jgi:hypothetical protein
MSRAICGSSDGAMSRPLCIGTVVPRPSAWGYWMCEPSQERPSSFQYRHRTIAPLVRFINRA